MAQKPRRQGRGCHLIADEIRTGTKHIGCQGELVFPASQFMNNAETKDFSDRIADCLWGKIKSKGVGKIVEGLPEGVAKGLIQEALKKGVKEVEKLINFTDATHQIRATCSNEGINVFVFTKISFTVDAETFVMETDEKALGNCNSASLDARDIYNLGCRCCPKSHFHPDHPKEQNQEE